MRRTRISGSSGDPADQPLLIRVAVGDFALRALHLAGYEEEALAQPIESALYFYLGAREARPPGWSFPRFERPGDGPPATEVEIAVEPAFWRRFAIEAEAQGVEPGALVGHAVLFYLADLDARGGGEGI